MLHIVLLARGGWLQGAENSLRWLMIVIDDLCFFEVLGAFPFEVPVCEIGSTRSEQRAHKHAKEPYNTVPG